MYRFKVKRPRVQRIDPVLPEKPVKEPEQLGFIHGQVPGSKEEWRAAVALEKMGLAYWYQVPVGGGRDVAGGQVLDFLVYTVPLPTPVYIQGQYWHSGAQAMKTTFNVSRMRKQLANLGIQANPPVEVWDYDLLSVENAYSTFRRLFG